VKVSVEGKTAENLDTKLSIIKQTLARLEAPPLKPGQRQPASKQAANAKGSQAASNTQQLDQNANQNSNGENAQTAQNNDKDKSKFEPVPCRIVEKNSDGSYRVKGQQTVYVGKHEYRLVVTGILHADDISDGSITSGKLLDSKFDLVASNKDVKNDLLR
jgi:flagellar basal body L-ring protein FlgH